MVSHEAVSWALHDAPMPMTEKGKTDSTARLVLVELAEHAAVDGRNSFPSVLHIRYATGLDERTIQRALRRLEEGGLIQRDGVARNGCTRWKLHMSVTRPDTDWVFLEGEAEEAKRRQTAARAVRRSRSAVAAVSGTQSAGHDPLSGTENPGHEGLSGTQNAGQPTDVRDAECVVRDAESRRPALCVPASGTQNPGVRHGTPPEPSVNPQEPPGTVTGGHAAPRTPLRRDDPQAGRLNDQANSPSEVDLFETGLGTQPTTARVRCLHGLSAHTDPATGEPTCPLCRRALEAS
ncbi:Helix-turn-helix domain-containing protein [Amycolatopsis rubida]|uniref:Helix-turn-helix domain-containing protein n=1 Tax=Amycolatopsis rubida TaxID=112413 RepID=A0A1I5IJ01_9PSEU|nr:Helix-turn-helix domain-containing protein [Amycolatopsis rubida]